jgi:NMD protein affecting ribosome stability and mRNA decay
MVICNRCGEEFEVHELNDIGLCDDCAEDEEKLARMREEEEEEE